MAEFVFLPLRRSRPQETLAAIAVDAGDEAVTLGAEPALAAPPDPYAARPRALGARRRMRRGRGAARKVEVMDVVRQTGAALVKSSVGAPPDNAVGSYVPVVNYTPAIATLRIGSSPIRFQGGPAGAAFFQLKVISSADGQPVANAVALLRLRSGARELTAVTDAAGMATFGLRAPAVAGATLLVEPGFHGHWGHMRRNVSLASCDTVTVDRIDLSGGPDCLRKMVATGDPAAGAGVTVAVIDTGVGPHPDLPNASGDADTSFGHGTHVAGIVAGRGAAGWGGVAPGATVRSYRVFNDPATGVAKNYEIYQAIYQALDDGCHIINLSLKTDGLQRHDDPVLAAAIDDAADEGVLCVAAAGNDFRRHVSYPARHPLVLAVAALGRESCLPADAYDRWTVSSDRGAPDADLYFATFSNEGKDGTTVHVCAPGAGVISTVPGGRYAPMSGTSMACPAMVGAIARILAVRPDILAMPKDRTRYDAIRAAALANFTRFGFRPEWEGQGMIA